MQYAKYVAKAIYAGVVAALGGLAVIVVGDTALVDVTTAQWITVALATIIAVGGTFGLSNGPKPE